MFKKTALVAGIGLALSVTAQADYRWELGAGYAKGSYDFKLKNLPDGDRRSDDSDVDIGRVEGTYFLENVDTSKGPLGEAAFLDHASSITLAFADGELDVSGGDDKDGQVYKLQTRYVAEGPGWKLSGWLVDLGYERQEPGDKDIDLYNIGIGKYLTPNTTAVVGYEKLNINNGGDANRYGLFLNHFFAFDNGGIKARANGGKTQVSGEDDPTTWGLGATWYIGNNWGIGADYEKDDASGFETDIFRLNAEWFITENFAVEVSYKDIQPDDINFRDIGDGGAKLESEYDEYGISALYRF